VRSILISFLILVASCVTSSAQEWHGIRLLQSTCDDVKRGLNVDKCEYPKSVYKFPRETVTVGFVMCPCPIRCYHASGGWNVPRGTVAGITREFLTSVSVEELFDVKNGKWDPFETDMIGEVQYINPEEAIHLYTLNGKVMKAIYLPAADKHKDKLCPTCTVPQPPPTGKSETVWLRGYAGGDTKNAEEKLLDAFAEELRVQGNDIRGYIVAYDGCLKRGEAAIRADRAKKYLVSTRGIDHSQIIIIEGGQRSGLSIELHVRKSTSPPPQTLSSVYPRVPD
jgi:hypothetical protein